jgi:transcriptional regulator
MYVHPAFAEKNSTFWKDFVNSHPLGLLIHSKGGEYFATHLPMILIPSVAGDEVIAGHLPLNNPQASLIKKGWRALAVFSSTPVYISGSWYGKPSVPTMNYEAVHVQGIISPTSSERLREILSLMTQRLEVMYNPENPLQLEHLPSDYLEANYEVLMGFEMTIEKVEATRKLSQNKSHPDRLNIIKQLIRRNNSGDIIMAETMMEITVRAMQSESP